jgi:rhamnulose-1-phosphate aldolase
VKQILADIADIAGLIYQRGWAERNAGNISIDVTDSHAWAKDMRRGRRVETPLLYPELAGRSYLVTATGSRFREIAKHPEKNVVLAKVADDLSGYQILLSPHEDADLLTSSEFPSHLGVHAYLRRIHPEIKTVLHTHPDHLLALTHITKYCSSDALSHLLWSMHPEMKVVMPEGVGLVPYCQPGSQVLADATVDILEHHRLALWEKHGCVAIGRNVYDAFDLVETAEKSAKLYFLVKAAGFDAGGLTEGQLGDLDELILKLRQQAQG